MGLRSRVVGCLCVPFFLPVDIDHTQCPWRFFLLHPTPIKYQVDLRDKYKLWQLVEPDESCRFKCRFTFFFFFPSPLQIRLRN